MWLPFWSCQEVEVKRTQRGENERALPAPCVPHNFLVPTPGQKTCWWPVSTWIDAQRPGSQEKHRLKPQGDTTAHLCERGQREAGPHRWGSANRCGRFGRRLCSLLQGDTFIYLPR